MTTDKDKDKLKQRAAYLTRRRGSSNRINPLDDAAGGGMGNWKSSTDGQRQVYRRRLRRLLKSSQANENDNRAISKSNHTPWSLKRHSHALFLLISAICLGCILYYCNESMTKFLQSYTNQYHDIVHNKLNYCDRSLALGEMFTELRGRVLHQDIALNQLERIMANNQSFQSIALVGSSGLGKSLTVRLLRELFPWRENVHAVNWHYHLEETIDTMLSKFQFSHCGRNLVIIDNMPMGDQDFVKIINDAVQQRASSNGTPENNANSQHVTMIYVFNINRMILSNQEYDEQLNQLQQELSEPTQMISYRTFQRHHLELCIRSEVLKNNLNLSEIYLEEMLNTTDVEISGCKTVYAKVLIYGTKTEEE
ncbi:uncharacterized protein [Drosophila tropicalis]|uniref:uncharacterized protein n=1 Tax=Drosophila tropicalis TaxID=46794 RepID=UPI0035ABAC78